jgi:hypothetical protein
VPSFKYGLSGFELLSRRAAPMRAARLYRDVDDGKNENRLRRFF